MKAATRPAQTYLSERQAGYELRVSAYERVTSWIVSLLILVGTCVFVLFVLWISSRIFATQVAVPVIMQEVGTGEGGLAGGMELEEPPAEQLGQESDIEEPLLEKTLAIVAEAVAERLAQLEDPLATEDPVAGKGGSTGRGDATGVGIGAGGGRRRHWEVRFPEGNTIDTYARALDFFKIELGVLLPDNRVLYVYNLSKPRPDTRIGPADQERRYYLTWRRGTLMEADRELLRRAGVDPGDRLILKFIPPELEAQLAEMERARAGPRHDRVRTTYFAVVPQGNGFRFIVVDQVLR
ncbi:MAG: hypothetical protein NZ899_07560 [Thermoguttaceae bacterium]|nr:hypothetical protein [Thermoguttaceae bacterium]MDW8079000.1 hypothetical protein [Thermoguttaceae bacterium]